MQNLLSFRAAGVGTVLFASCLVFAPGARASQPPPNQQTKQTLFVDDDKKECPWAQYTDLRAAAVAALPGATILVCPGTYPGPIVVTRQLTFIAFTRGVAGGGDERDFDENNGGARRRDADDPSREAIVLAGPAGDGFTLVADTAGTVITGFVISGSAQPVFDAGINIKDPSGTGYQILDNLITGNNVGMYFHSIGGKQSRIEGNAFVGNNAGGFPTPNTGTAIFTQGFQINDTEIKHNYFEGHQDSALNLGDGSQHGLVINANKSVNDSTFLVLGRASGSVVSDNRIEGSSTSGLYFFGQNFGVLVAGNELQAGPGNLSSGIRLTGPYFGAAGPNGQMSIARNHVRNFGYGIRGSNVEDSVFDHNMVRDNSVDGIQMSPLTFIPATGNTLADNDARDDAVYDCEDQSMGLGTAGTANFWRDDQGEKANPPGICH